MGASRVTGAALGVSAIAAVIGLSACESERPALSRASVDTGTEWKGQLAKLPQQALVGADTVRLNDLLFDVRPVPVRGRFESEHGGAQATVYMEPTDTGLGLVRRVEQPGASPREKSYELMAKGQEGQWLRGAGVEVLGVKGGIAVLEKHASVEGVPSSVWIVYERARTAANL